MNKRMLFVVAAIILAVLGLYYRSENAKTAHALADEIVQLDNTGSDTKATSADLKAFVSAHMGASVSYTLSGSYNRALAAAQAATAAQDPNASLYADAQRACSGKTDSLTQARCNEAYIQAHQVTAPAPSPAPTPKAADYRVALRAPFWSPDLAGALLLGAAAALAVGLAMGRRRR